MDVGVFMRMDKVEDKLKLKKTWKQRETLVTSSSLKYSDCVGQYSKFSVSVDMLDDNMYLYEGRDYSTVLAADNEALQTLLAGEKCCHTVQGV